MTTLKTISLVEGCLIRARYTIEESDDGQFYAIGWIISQHDESECEAVDCIDYDHAMVTILEMALNEAASRASLKVSKK